MTALRHTSRSPFWFAVCVFGLVVGHTAVLPQSDRAPTANSSLERRGEDWPRFLGPRGDGTSSERGLLKSLSRSGPPVLWFLSLGASFSPPVTSRGRLIIFHREGMEEVLECLDSRTGARIWKQTYPTSYRDRYGYNNGPRSSPTIVGNRVYALGAEGKLSCLDFKDGKILWQRWINRDFKVKQNFFGVGSAPVLDDDLILLNVGGPGAGVVALERKSGKTIWKTSDQSASYSTPLVRTVNNQRLALFFTREGLLAVERDSGREVYRYPFRSRSYESVNAAVPLLVDDHIFLSATYNTGSVLLKLDPGQPREIWKSRSAMQNHWATSIYYQGNLYGVSGRHESGADIRCIDFKTGRVRWQAQPSLGRAGFILADGYFIAMGERGDLILIEVNQDRYIEKGRVRLLTYPCWAPPVLSHGLLYLRNETKLLCLDLREAR